jgi:uncharacterized protein
VRSDDPLAVELTAVIRAGDLETLATLLAARPGVASLAIEDRKGGVRTPLHLATDWPGYFPNGPAVVRMLLSAGASPDPPSLAGPPSETPLHWAASTDDVDVAEALIEGGADLEAPGGSISGTPLGNAVGYGCWRVARLLVQHGARVESLWQAAALGMAQRVDELLEAVAPTAQELTDAFWQACHGGHRRIAERLLALGADLNGTPSWGDDTPLRVAESVDAGREALLTWLRELGATSSSRAET